MAKFAEETGTVEVVDGAFFLTDGVDADVATMTGWLTYSTQLCNMSPAGSGMEEKTSTSK